MYQLQTLSVSCEFPVTFLPGTFFYIYLNGSAGTQPSPPSVLEFYAVLAAASYCPDIRNRNSAQSQPGCRCPGGEGALPLSRTLSFSALRGLLSPSWVVRFMKKLPVSRVALPSAISLLITLTLCSLVCKSKTCSNKHDSVNICKAFRRASHTYEELLLLIWFLLLPLSQISSWSPAEPLILLLLCWWLWKSTWSRNGVENIWFPLHFVAAKEVPCESLDAQKFFFCFFSLVVCALGVIFCMCLLSCPSTIYHWLNGKDSACQCRRYRVNPWVRKMPWSKKWHPTPVF